MRCQNGERVRSGTSTVGEGGRISCRPIQHFLTIKSTNRNKHSYTWPDRSTCGPVTGPRTEWTRSTGGPGGPGGPPVGGGGGRVSTQTSHSSQAHNENITSHYIISVAEAGRFGVGVRGADWWRQMAKCRLHGFWIPHWIPHWMSLSTLPLQRETHK